MMSSDFDEHILRSFGAEGRILEELIQYCDHTFEKSSEKRGQKEPDAPHIKSYLHYEEESQTRGAFETLSQYLVQLQFPVQAGISQTKIYKNVVLCGKAKKDGVELDLINPKEIRLKVHHDDLIGNVPVLQVPNKSDFVKIVCALTNRNEPKSISESIGAAFIKGLNNWGRIKELKRDWLARNPIGSWYQEFQQNIRPRCELYQDQLIILSEKPYSNVNAEALNLSEEIWKSHSIDIRRAHECAHLFTLRQYGKIRNHIFDELIADYVGIMSVLGRFDLTWFLHFMGLKIETKYQVKASGRFHNYTADLSSEAVRVLQNILIKAASNLYEFDSNIGVPSNSKCLRSRLKSLCETGFITLASEHGSKVLQNKYDTYVSVPEVL